MNLIDLYTSIPLLVTGVSVVLVMLVIAFYRNHFLTASLSIAALVVAFGSLWPVSALVPKKMTPLLLVDGYSIFFMGLILAASAAVSLLSYGYLHRREEDREEFYVLLLMATLGALVLVCSGHFASFLLGLEIMSVSLYCLIAYPRKSPKSIEAGTKYLILAASSDAFMVFGMALLYAKTGTLEFSRMIVSTWEMGGASSRIGLSMLLTGVGFKLSLVPFHMWIADVYEGSPAPVTAYVATVSKGAMFVLLFRYFAQAAVKDYGSVVVLFTVLATGSMFVGNLLAMRQTNVKRMLAYSSIAHFGYLVVAFLASGEMAVFAVSYYLVAYFVTTLGSFGVITVMSGTETEREAIEDYRGLVRSRPWLCALFSVMLLSLAGIPLTAGFIGKFFLMTAGLGSGLQWLVIMLVVNSVIGLVYYLRVLLTMYGPLASDAEPAVEEPHSSLAGNIVLATLLLLVVWLGVFPGTLVTIIEATVASLL